MRYASGLQLQGLLTQSQSKNFPSQVEIDGKNVQIHLYDSTMSIFSTYILPNLVYILVPSQILNIEEKLVYSRVRDRGIGGYVQPPRGGTTPSEMKFH